MEKILFVDDSAFFRKIVHQELTEGGYHVDTAKSAEEANSYACQNDYFLAILDVEMPDKNGFETLVGLRKIERFSNTNVPIIFFTSTDKSEQRAKGFEVGATDFINKDFSEGELLGSVKKILRPDKRFHGMTALCVDDMKLCRKVVADNLEQVGIHVIEAEDGAIALKIYKEYHEEIDIIITDKEMPNMDGLEFVKAVRLDLGATEIPIIILTADPSREAIVEFFKCGATDYLLKPYLKEEFVTRVHSQLESYTLKKSLYGNIERLRKLNLLKDKFLSACSHDLRSPLNGILGFSGLMKRDVQLDDKTRKKAELIHESGQYLLTLINNLLDLKKIGFDDHIDLTTVVPSEVIRESVEMMVPAAKVKKIDLILKKNQREEHHIHGDRLSLKRMLNNLISNAIKFSDPGQKVIVTYGANSSHYIIQVKDQGIGIDADNLDSIFDEYTKDSTTGTTGEAGTGLGLAISKRIIDHHGGSITVSSTPKEGSTFTVKIPFNEAIEVA